MAPAHKIVLAALAAGLAAPIAAAQQVEVLYSQNFETGTTFPGWSTHTVAHTPAFTRFLGRFSNERVTLTVELPQLPQTGDSTGGGEGGGGGGEGGGGEGGGSGGGGELPPWNFVLSFSFYCIDSWDGDDPLWGPDRFRVLIDNTPYLDELFGPYNPVRPPDVGHAHLGFNDQHMDTIYQITIPFVVPAGVHQFHFEAEGLQALNDESWGIDNVTIAMVRPIPAPGAAAAAGVLGVLTAARRRRR